jgi:hypothetical protein
VKNLFWSLLLFLSPYFFAHTVSAQNVRLFRLDNGGTLRIVKGKMEMLKGSPEGKPVLSGEQMRFFSGGRLFVKQNGRWGLADLEGKLLLDPANGFFLVRPFQEGLAWVSPASGNLALLKKDGKTVPLATRVQDATNVEKGSCWIRVGNIWTLMDANGQMLLPLEKAGQLPYPVQGSPLYWLNQGGARKGADGPFKGGKWALVAPSGKWVLDYANGPDHALTFSGGRSWANKGGTWIGNHLFGGKWILLDSTGKAVLDYTAEFDHVRPFSGGLAWASQGGKWNGDQFRPGAWGILGPDGKWRVKATFKYDEVGEFSENRCWVRQNKGWALVDGSGGTVLAPDTSIQKTTPVRNGFCWTGDRSGQWRLLSAEGQYVAGAEDFQEVRDFANGVGWGKRAGKWGLVKADGQWTAVADLLEVQAFSEGLAAVQTPNGWIFVDPKGQPAFEGSFQKIIDGFSGGRAEVQIEDLSFFLNLKGEILAK